MFIENIKLYFYLSDTHCNTSLIKNVKFNKQIFRNNEIVRIVCPAGYSNPDEIRVCKNTTIHPTEEDSSFRCFKGKFISSFTFCLIGYQ